MATGDGQPAPDAAPITAELTTFNARLPMHLKKVFQRAADLRGQSLSDFVLGAAYERAMATIAAENVIRLSERDSEAFARALRDPSPVDEAVLGRFRDAHRKSRQ